MANNPPAATTDADKPQDDTIKETFESIVIAFILAFVFRAYVVEAFVIPTGSMAPTLLGEHIRITCEKCGYHFKVDNPAPPGSGVKVAGRQLKEELQYACPMCQYDHVVKKDTFISSGDRILVHKYLYSINEPCRWDVVVFKAPHRPQTNYIKRLVGLPEQETAIIEGNVYYNPTPGDPAGWRIARKTDPRENAHAEKIQRAVWQPMYHSQYVPLDYDPAAASNRWQPPWIITTDGGAQMQPWKRGTSRENDPELDPRRGFVFDSTGKGSLRFAFQRVFGSYGAGAGFFPYGQGRGGNDTVIPVEDVRLALAVQPRQDGLRITLRTTARLDDIEGRTHSLKATIDAQGNANLWRSDQEKPLATEHIGALAAGQTRFIELWYVDQEASLWIDGERVLLKRFDNLTYEQVLMRSIPFASFESAALKAEHHDLNGEARRMDLHVPVVEVEVEGSPLTLHRIELDRDLYYTSTGKGTVSKTQDRFSGGPVRLRADEFFCLGDNSPSSADGRAWLTVDPWVLSRSFAEGATVDESRGVVPRRLMMGKAFFVYFPSMIGFTPQSYPYCPNFGEMRFIH